MGKPGIETGESDDDILGLAAPQHRHRTLGRLGLLFLGAAVGMLLTALLLSSAFGGTLLDLFVLALLFGCVALAVPGLGLLGAAGLDRLKQRRTADLLGNGDAPDR